MMLSASQPHPSHLLTHSRNALQGLWLGKRAAHVASTLGSVHQLWHFHAPHPSIAPPSTPSFLQCPQPTRGQTEPLKSPGMLQAAEASSGSPASLLHHTCREFSWKTHQTLPSLALDKAAGSQHP